VQSLQWVHQARASQLARSAASLKAQYGAQDAGVKRAEAALAAARAAGSRLALVHEQLTTPAPTVTPDGWALHGRVVTADSKPFRGFTVFLVDSAKAYQQAYGFAYTDAAGYFLLSYEPGGAASGDPSPTPPDATATELFVEVTDQNARSVYLSAIPFDPVRGAATYQTVVLAEGAPPIGKPPADARKPAPKRVPKS